jgi:hypothetical protein
LTLEEHANYHVVCFTEIFENIDRLIEVNELVRSKGKGFILSLAYGPSGIAFVDYGNEFLVTDTDGEETK